MFTAVSGKKGSSLEERSVEIVSRDNDLNENEESSERHSHEAIDERSVESCKARESKLAVQNSEEAAEETNQKVE